MTDRKRVAIVEDHALLAQTLQMALYSTPLLPLVTTLPVHGERLIDKILASRPDLVLLDLDLGPAGDGAVVIGPLSRLRIPVAVMTGSRDPRRHGQCLSEGAAVVVPKSVAASTLARVLLGLSQGRTVMPPAERVRLIQLWRSRPRDQDEPPRHPGFERLTRREREVLQGLVQGHRVSDIAATSGVSKLTVRAQVKSILFKLGVDSQLAAVAAAHQVGWHAETPAGYDTLGQSRVLAR